MRFLRLMTKGDRFRVAHPRQVSLNGKEMSRGNIFKVTRVYEMSPNTVLCLKVSSPGEGIYSLGPGTPVLLPREPDPTEGEILEFLGVKTKKRVIAYRVLWDGKTNLSGVIPPQAIAGMNLMFAMGKSEYTVRELNRLFDKHYEEFWGRPVKRQANFIMQFYRRYMVDKGLIEEIVDVGVVPNAVGEANLQEVY